MVHEINSANFESDVLGSNLPVLIDFYAPWCGPCKVLAPHLDKLSDRYEGRLKVCKLNIDRNGVISRRYNVTSIPRLMLFDQGHKVGLLVGAQPISAIESFIAQRLRERLAAATPAPASVAAPDQQTPSAQPEEPKGIMFGLVQPSHSRNGS